QLVAVIRRLGRRRVLAAGADAHTDEQRGHDADHPRPAPVLLRLRGFWFRSGLGRVSEDRVRVRVLRWGGHGLVPSVSGGGRWESRRRRGAAAAITRCIGGGEGCAPPAAGCLPSANCSALGWNVRDTRRERDTH